MVIFTECQPGETYEHGTIYKLTPAGAISILHFLFTIDDSSVAIRRHITVNIRQVYL